MNQPRENPKVTLTIGLWTLLLETRRMTIRNEREVRSSDTGDGGKGTLLRTEKHSCKMVVHTVDITNAKGASIKLSVCIQGSRTTVTKLTPSDRTDVDDKPLPDVKVSYSLRQACDMLKRILGVDERTATLVILAPLPDEEAKGDATSIQTFRQSFALQGVA